MLMVAAVPIWVHVVPLVERYAVNVLPLRTSFTQYGIACAVAVVVARVAPAVVRRPNTAAPAEVNMTLAALALAASVSRNMTPASAAPLVAWDAVTRAMMVPLPVSC